MPVGRTTGFGVMVVATCSQPTKNDLIWNAFECTSGHPARVGYTDPARAIGVAMRRAWAPAWVVWGDTTERQPRTSVTDANIINLALSKIM